MSITQKEVENIALLSRLALAKEEKELFSIQLNDVLTHIDKLNELSTDGVNENMNLIENTSLRPDENRQPFFEGDLLMNAPNKEKGHFKVPKIVE